MSMKFQLDSNDIFIDYLTMFTYIQKLVIVISLLSLKSTYVINCLDLAANHRMTRVSNAL